MTVQRAGTTHRFPRAWSRGPLYVERGDGLLVWVGRLRFKVQIRVWWSRG